MNRPCGSCKYSKYHRDMDDLYCYHPDVAAPSAANETKLIPTLTSARPCGKQFQKFEKDTENKS